MGRSWRKTGRVGPWAEVLCFAFVAGCSTNSKQGMPAAEAGPGGDGAGGSSSGMGLGSAGSKNNGKAGESSGSGGKVSTGGMPSGTAGTPSGSGGMPDGSAGSGGSTNTGSGGTPSGSIVFHDDFSGAWPGEWTAVDRPGDASNNELVCYKPANAKPNAGMLEITSKSDTACNGYAYTSAMVQWTKFSFTYGTIEVRAKLAGGKGPWPAIWLLGANCQTTNLTTPDNTGKCSWPNPGSDEIDITEMLGSGRTQVNQQIHAATGDPGCKAPVSDTSANFHNYRLVWKKGSVVWSIDGKETCTITQSVPTTPMFLIINTAVGGVGGGDVDAATLPVTTFVDEVTVWQ